MRDEDRGKIHNREWAGRLRDFSGLRFGKITPTDIDGFMDFNDRVFIFIETKRGNSEMKYGQRLALERLSDASAQSGRHAIVIIASHIEEGDIAVAGLPVVLLRLNGIWRKPHKSINVRTAIEDYLAWATKHETTKNHP